MSNILLKQYMSRKKKTLVRQKLQFNLHPMSDSIWRNACVANEPCATQEMVPVLNYIWMMCKYVKEVLGN